MIIGYEKFILSEEECENAPKGAKDVFEENSSEGIPAAIGRCEELGWFVICTAGQGAFVCWSEKEK